MTRMIPSWLSGPARRRCRPEWPAVGVPPPCEVDPGRRAELNRETGYPGEALGLPQHGPGSLAATGRRFVALAVDWLVSYGLAASGLATSVVSEAALPTAVLVVWLLLGAVAVRLFGFTPGQFACGLQVVTVGTADHPVHVGIGRAVTRGALIALVIPVLLVDTDGRGLQDRVTATAVVRR